LKRRGRPPLFSIGPQGGREGKKKRRKKGKKRFTSRVPKEKNLHPDPRASTQLSQSTTNCRNSSICDVKVSRGRPAIGYGSRGKEKKGKRRTPPPPPPPSNLLSTLKIHPLLHALQSPKE